MGKWTALKANYPKAPLEGDYQLKVEAVKKEFMALDPADLKDEYVRLRWSKEKLKEGLSQVNAELEAVEQIFVDRMESEGVTNQKFEDGLQLILKDEPSFKVIDEGKFRIWLESSPDHLAEFPLTVHAATLKARLKGRLEAGDDLPPGTEIGWIDTSLSARGLPKSKG